MNSLWGAGQMMFTKMMSVVDGDVNIHDQQEVAKYISDNVDPLRDITYSQGPTDVLDHSCSRMAFGGKMGIDATRKLEEETIPGAMEDKVDVARLKKEVVEMQAVVNGFSELKSLNCRLADIGVPVVFVAIEKNRKGHVEEMAKTLLNEPAFSQVKVLIFLEHTMDIQDVADAVWRFSNNVDPRRDHFDVPAKTNGEVNHVAFDGTRKMKEFDGFDRDWPNILAADKETIRRVDELWPKLGLGKMIPSPSEKYANQLYEGGAVVKP
jgi:4-hydroxy-3-polyprenylbenzoate decarboxylase